MEQEKQIPIWFFIGLVLAVYGLLIVGSGIYGWLNPPDRKVALWEYHADIWWGTVLLILGLCYVAKYRPPLGPERKPDPDKSGVPGAH
jgi:hypothetical protein